MCDHVNFELKPPTPSTHLFKEECTLCFDDHDGSEGIDVCLTCFNGSCPRMHTQLHHAKKEHPIYLNIKRSEKPASSESRPEKMTKLSVQDKTPEYNFDTKVKCQKCAITLDKSVGNLQIIVDAVMDGMSMKKQAELKAWEEETLQECNHTNDLKQIKKCEILKKGENHCKDCDLSENLWLCLTCGNLGCGRSQFGVGGGNSHGLAHFDVSRHPVAVKMGSITPEGTAGLSRDN